MLDPPNPREGTETQTVLPDLQWLQVRAPPHPREGTETYQHCPFENHFPLEPP